MILNIGITIYLALKLQHSVLKSMSMMVPSLA